MNIIHETKWALLELFPEQAEEEKVKEEEARIKAEEEAKAFAEAEEMEPAEEETPSDEESKPRSVVDMAADEIDSIELVPKQEAGKEKGKEEADAGKPAEAAAPTAPEPEKKEEKAAEPEESEDEGPRTDGVLELDFQARGANLDVLCAPDQIVDVTRILDEAGFFLETISGVDWIKEDQMEVIYDYSIVADEPCRVVVRTRVPRSEPEVPTISDIYPGANWHERETHEFFGIKFEGHPYLVPLLLPEDADFYPLRKDFKP